MFWLFGQLVESYSVVLQRFKEFALKGHNPQASPYDNFLPIKFYLKKCNISEIFTIRKSLRTSVCLQ